MVALVIETLGKVRFIRALRILPIREKVLAKVRKIRIY